MIETNMIDELTNDVQRGREGFSFGNLVICMDWVEEMLGKYGAYLGDIRDELTMYQDEPEHGIRNPIADAAVVIARLDRLIGEAEHERDAERL